MDQDNIEKRRGNVPPPEKLRTLKQFRSMSQETFDEYYSKLVVDAVPAKEFEVRIEHKMGEIEKDYDLSDMKVNDLAQLRALCQTLISLEDLEQVSYKIRKEGISPINIAMLEMLGGIMNKLRGDISKFQDDLRITRKIRKGDKETSVMNYIKDLQEKAKKFLEAKQFYIFCPKCSMLLGTVWSHYPSEDRNKIAFICHRILEDGTECGNKVIISTKELLEMGGSNKLEIMPEVMR